MAKWISFWEVNNPFSPKRVTKIWHVQTKGDVPNVLGEIKWYPGWRKYCFFPDEGSLYEQDCLRDIAAFCEEKTLEHKQSKVPT